MPTHDYFHEVVKTALEKEGWVITHDPLIVPFGAINLHIDLGAERLIAAEKGSERIAVEVKTSYRLRWCLNFIQHSASSSIINLY